MGGSLALATNSTTFARNKFWKEILGIFLLYFWFLHSCGLCNGRWSSYEGNKQLSGNKLDFGWRDSWLCIARLWYCSDFEIPRNVSSGVRSSKVAKMGFQWRCHDKIRSLAVAKRGIDVLQPVHQKLDAILALLERSFCKLLMVGTVVTDMRREYLFWMCILAMGRFFLKIEYTFWSKELRGAIWVMAFQFVICFPFFFRKEEGTGSPFFF